MGSLQFVTPRINRITQGPFPSKTLQIAVIQPQKWRLRTQSRTRKRCRKATATAATAAATATPRGHFFFFDDFCGVFSASKETLLDHVLEPLHEPLLQLVRETLLPHRYLHPPPRQTSVGYSRNSPRRLNVMVINAEWDVKEYKECLQLHICTILDTGWSNPFSEFTYQISCVISLYAVTWDS